MENVFDQFDEADVAEAPLAAEDNVFNQFDEAPAPAPAPAPQPKGQPNFSQAFDAYSKGTMDPAKRTHFEELLKRKMPQIFHDQGMEQNTAKTLSDIAATAAKALPGSLWNAGKDMATALASPIDTAKAVGGVVQGGLSKLSGDYPSKTEADVANEGTWDMVAADVTERYGSREGFVKAVETDPATVLFDLAGILTLGGGTLAKVPGMAKSAAILSELGSSLDLVQQSGKLAVAVGKPLAKAGARVVDEGLGMTTGVGGHTIREAKGTTRDLFNTIEDTYKGQPKQGAGFNEARKGNVSVNELATRAKTAIADVREQRVQAFRDNLGELGTEPVDMDLVTGGLVDELEKLKVPMTEKGLDFSNVSASGGTTGALQKVSERVMKHTDDTPEGMLELRDYLDTVNSKDPKVLEFVDGVRKSIDDSLSDLPGYKKLRVEADNFDGLISEFESTLGLAPGKSGHEIVRKLVAVGDEDVGLRRRLLTELEGMADTSLAQEIAGLEMQRVLPKAMLTRAVAGGGIAVGLLSSIPLLATLAASSSPRLMGKLLYQYGYSRNTVKTTINALKKTGAFDQKVTTTAAIAGRAQKEEETK